MRGDRWPGTVNISLLNALIAAILIAGAADGQEFEARVVLDDGASLPSNPLIVPSPADACTIRFSMGDGLIVYSPQRASGRVDDCPVMIRLAGYHNADVVLHDGSVVVLKRLGGYSGSTVPLSELAAPKDAVKAYGKGVAAMNRKKWAAARKHFEAAVALYPIYARAWSDLGEVAKEQGRAYEAEAAYRRAIAADGTFVKPYVELAKIDLSSGRYEETLTVLSGALKQNTVEFPALYFYSALANFRMSRFEFAEKDARKCIEMDSRHEIPRAESLLARILLTHGDRAGALKHFRKYLELSPKAEDAAEVRGTMTELQASRGRE